jgi:hypothetical protein
MESPLVVVFLAVIAATALLQAGFVGALAFGARRGGRKLSELEEKFEAAVVPQIRNAARLTDKAVALSENGLAQAQRVDGLVADAARRAERHLDETTLRLESAMARAALRVDAGLAAGAARAREHRILRKLSSASAFVKGVQRALEVWEASAPARAEDDEMPPDGGPPADPSPA